MIPPSAPQETDDLLTESDQPQRFILARLDQLTIAFPSPMVAEILIVKRSQILALPFYNLCVLGIIHNAGQIVPLISMRQVVGITSGLTLENLTVVRLSDATKELAGIGLVFDMTLGIALPEQLPPDLFNAERSLDSTNSSSKIRLFQPEILSSQLWKPHRWQL